MNVTSCTQHSAGSGTIPYDAVDDSEMTGMFLLMFSHQCTCLTWYHVILQYTSDYLLQY